MTTVSPRRLARVVHRASPRSQLAEEQDLFRRCAERSSTTYRQGEWLHRPRPASVLERSASTRGWWRFEGVSMIDWVLMTDRLVISVEGKSTELLSAATDWYPERSQLVRNLEAARQLAHGRSWGSLLISEEALPQGSDVGFDGVLPASAPISTTPRAGNFMPTTWATSPGRWRARPPALTSRRCRPRPQRSDRPRWSATAREGRVATGVRSVRTHRRTAL